MERQTLRVLLRALPCLALGSLLSCAPARDRSAPPSADHREPEGVLARVNGVPVTEADLRAEIHSKTPGMELAPEQKKILLDRIIGKELVVQKATELGLGDAAYREELSRRTAELNAWKRQALADVYYRHEAAQATEVSEDEARRYFDENAAAIRTEVNVWQILARDEAQIAQARQDLAAGVPFEDVARKRFPDLPEGQKPWDLGFLKWKQVPAAWRDVLPSMKPGDTSDVIRGSGGRFWIIRLIDRREQGDLDFAQVKPVIMEDLKNERIEQARAHAADELRKSARVEYQKPAAK